MSSALLHLTFNHLYILLNQGDILHCRGMHVGWFSEECISHQVHHNFQWKPSVLPDSKKGRLCSWRSLYFLHWHTISVLLHFLFQVPRKLCTLWRRSWCGTWKLQVMCVTAECQDTCITDYSIECWNWNFIVVTNLCSFMLLWKNIGVSRNKEIAGILFVSMTFFILLN